MTQTNHIDHPAVEVTIPLGGEHQLEIPPATTLFFWGSIAVGTPDRIPPIRTLHGSRLFQSGLEAQDRMTWSLSIAGDSIPLLTDSYYREGGYKGLAWWTACEPVELPATVDVQFTTEGEPPIHGEAEVQLWTQQGEGIPWGETVESTIKMTPTDISESEFPTTRETLWGRHQVFVPQ